MVRSGKQRTCRRQKYFGNLRHVLGPVISCSLFYDCLTLRILNSYLSKRRCCPSDPPSHYRTFDTSAVPLFCLFLCLFVFGPTAPSGPGTSSFTRFLDHTQRRTSFGGTPLDEWSAGRKRPVPDNTTITTDRHPCPRWGSNPRSQQASGRRPTP